MPSNRIQWTNHSSHRLTSQPRNKQTSLPRHRLPLANLIMSKRQRLWAYRARLALVATLGGKCAHCGSTHDLELDHIYGATWRHRSIEYSHRISIYRREAKRGLLQVLCRTCNLAKRTRPPVPTSVPRTGDFPSKEDRV